ncbi:MAG: hypothetical protein LBB36_00420 [Fibromonadaceae bacterium]|jgi:hypothetical protein|nr:hypothetical protein [Fibromonadaceae bacterium]
MKNIAGKVPSIQVPIHSELQEEIDDAVILATRFDEMLKPIGKSKPNVFYITPRLGL